MKRDTFLFRHLGLRDRGLSLFAEQEGDPGGGGAGEGKEGGDKGGDEKPTVEALQAQLADLQKQNATLQKDVKTEKTSRIEAEKTAAVWHERATKPGEKPAADTKPEDVDLVEAITNGDKKAVTTALKGMGFFTKAEVESMVNDRVQTERSTAATNSQLAKDYPTLGDANSEHFKRTAEIFQELEKEGIPEGRALEMAADGAAARLGIKRGAKAEETEEERAERIGSQAGQRGSRGTATKKSELSADERKICENLGITPEKFLAQKKKYDEAA